jgi:hypothetical protein
MQASSTRPTVAQERTIEQLGAQLKVDLAALNALLAGRFAGCSGRRRAGVVLKAVVVPRQRPSATPDRGPRQSRLDDTYRKCLVQWSGVAI